MKKEIREFWIQNGWLLERYEEDYGLNGRDYIMSIDDVEELEEILKNYL